MRTTLKEITERTLIPISFLVIFTGFVFWLTSVFNTVEAHTKQLQEIQVEQVKRADRMEEVLTRLVVLEQILKQLEKNSRR